MWRKDKMIAIFFLVRSRTEWTGVYVPLFAMCWHDEIPCGKFHLQILFWRSHWSSFSRVAALFLSCDNFEASACIIHSKSFLSAIIYQEIARLKDKCRRYFNRGKVWGGSTNGGNYSLRVNNSCAMVQNCYRVASYKDTRLCSLEFILDATLS